MFSAYSWLCSQELLLLLLRGPYGMPEIKTRLATCKKKILSIVLSLRPLKQILFVCLFFWFLFGSHPAMYRGGGLLLALHSGITVAVLRGPYGMLGIEPGLATCKANALPAVLLSQPLKQIFLTGEKRKTEIWSKRQ